MKYWESAETCELPWPPGERQATAAAPRYGRGLYVVVVMSSIYNPNVLVAEGIYMTGHRVCSVISDTAGAGA